MVPLVIMDFNCITISIIVDLFFTEPSCDRQGILEEETFLCRFSGIRKLSDITCQVQLSQAALTSTRS